MDKRTATLFGAAAALAAVPALASPPQAPAVPQASSYADLLTPIPNAVERLQAADAQDAKLIPAQYDDYGRYNRHHHHHHHHNRGWYLSHGYYWYGGAWVL